jgi:hypothetical protein
VRHTEERESADGLVSALFPRLVLCPPPAETEIAEVLEAADVDTWAIEHEAARDGHECEDLLLHYHAETRRAVFCPQCHVLVGEDSWATANPAGSPPGPTHAETAVLVLRANAAVGALLGLVTWLASLGFTSPDLALLVAVGALAVYGVLTRPAA